MILNHCSILCQPIYWAINWPIYWICPIMRMIHLVSVSISIMLSLSTIGTSIAQVQSIIDVEPPVIELEELTEGTAGETQVFTALVVDNKILKDVKLYYRFSG